MVDDPKVIARFLSKIEPEPNSGCWLWTAGKVEDGYGAFAITASEYGVCESVIGSIVHHRTWRETASG